MKVIWNSAEKKTYDELDIALQLGSAGYYELVVLFQLVEFIGIFKT